MFFNNVAYLVYLICLICCGCSCLYLFCLLLLLTYCVCFGFDCFMFTLHVSFTCMFVVLGLVIGFVSCVWLLRFVVLLLCCFWCGCLLAYAVLRIVI